MPQIQNNIRNQRGNQIFKDKLEQASSPQRLLEICSRWIYWNNAFGGAVAGLASTVSAATSMFGSSVRSSKIASQIFFAARDEYGDAVAYGTHVELAAATLVGLGRALLGQYELSNPDLNTQKLMSEAIKGYRARGASSDEELWKGLGFHLGSETLADQEFRIFSAFLKSRHPDAVRFMQSGKVTIDGAFYLPWYWISIHGGEHEQGGVEQDHAQAAYSAIELSHLHYTGSATRAKCEQWILDGFQEFRDHQTRRMQTL